MANEENLLSGGNITGAVRIGATLHRATGPWSQAVHSLLLYLEKQGFDGAPRFLGLNQQGREILTFIEGEVAHYPLPLYMWSEDVLVEVAQFLRRYHDATVGFVPPPGAIWQFEYPDRHQHEIICHNDVAPYNMVFKDGKPQALIDFDTAGPGPRIWDIAYAAYRFVPLSYTQDIQSVGLANPTIQGWRLRLFCHAYDLAQPYSDVLGTVERRLEALCNLLKDQASAHNPIYQKLVDEGHLDHYQREIASLQQHRSEIEQSLIS